MHQESDGTSEPKITAELHETSGEALNDKLIGGTPATRRLQTAHLSPF
ncbi:hypothetical protein [Streptomyces sp. NBC_00236]|nr:hypothetical protein [Streptomyces sp. NBC_00236]